MFPKDHPATLLFSEEDLQAVAAGTVVTKVVLLEHPENGAGADRDQIGIVDRNRGVSQAEIHYSTHSFAAGRFS